MINTPPTLTPIPVRQSGKESPVAIFDKGWASWFTQAFNILFAVQQSGTSAQRPTQPSALWTGRTYFDTTISRPIWWDGTQWINAAGTPV